MHLVPYQSKLPIADMQALVSGIGKKVSTAYPTWRLTENRKCIVVAMIISARYSSEHLSLYNSSNIYGRSQSLHIWTFH